MSDDPLERISALLDLEGLVTADEMRQANFGTKWRTAALQAGFLKRACRGVYIPGNAPDDQKTLTRITCSRVPKAVVCLKSAAAIHELLEPSPDLWLGIGHGSWRSTTKLPLPIKWVCRPPKDRFTDVQLHIVWKVPVTTPERTIAELLKFRKRVGESCAQDALRNFVRSPYADLQILRATCEVLGVRRMLEDWLLG